MSSFNPDNVSGAQPFPTRLAPTIMIELLGACYGYSSNTIHMFQHALGRPLGASWVAGSWLIIHPEAKNLYPIQYELG
jgi:hypothetical protein